MKKDLLLTIVLVSASFLSHAQIAKGATFLGGSLGYYSAKEETATPVGQENKNNNWNTQVQIGKAIRENGIMGFFVAFGGGKNKSVNSLPAVDEVRSLTGGGGVFYRRYYPFSTRFYLFGEGSLGLSAETEKRETNALRTSKRNNTALNAGITPGISFAASRKLYLETSLNNLFSLNYLWGKTENYAQGGSNYITKNKRLFAGANSSGFSSIAIGLRWILPSK